MRLSREVRIGELVAALVAISALATGYVEVRLQPLQTQIAALREAQVTQHEQSAAYMRELRSDMRDLSAKLDRLIEGLQAWKR